MSLKNIFYKMTIVMVLISFSLIANSTNWEKITSKDEFEGTSSELVASHFVPPDKKLDFPYADLEASFGRRCGDDSRIFIVFNKNPNLTNGKNIKKYKSNLDVEYPAEYEIRMKIDNKIITRRGEMDSLNGKLFLITNEHLSNRYDEVFGKTLMIDILSKKFKEITFEFKGYSGKIYFTWDFREMITC